MVHAALLCHSLTEWAAAEDLLLDLGRGGDDTAIVVGEHNNRLARKSGRNKRSQLA